MNFVSVRAVRGDRGLAPISAMTASQRADTTSGLVGVGSFEHLAARICQDLLGPAGKKVRVARSGRRRGEPSRTRELPAVRGGRRENASFAASLAFRGSAFAIPASVGLEDTGGQQRRARLPERVGPAKVYARRETCKSLTEAYRRGATSRPRTRAAPTEAWEVPAASEIAREPRPSPSDRRGSSRPLHRDLKACGVPFPPRSHF